MVALASLMAAAAMAGALALRRALARAGFSSPPMAAARVDRQAQPRTRAGVAATCARLTAALALVSATACTGTITDPGATGGDPGVAACGTGESVDPGPAPLVRLTTAQYALTARDLFGEVALDDVLPAPTAAGHIGLAQGDVSQFDVEQYGRAAERVGEHVAARVQEFAPCSAPADPADAEACARAFLAGFGTRIYRSPLGDADIDALASVFALGYETGGYAGGIGLVVTAMLQAPRFLYRPELGEPSRASATAVPLTGYEVASRLSFALWNRGPDERLLAAAADGSLSTTEGIAAEAARLIADPRAEQSFRDFLYVWFGLTDQDAVEKDPAAFPDWSPEVHAAMLAQSEAFFDHVLFGEGGTLESMFLTPVEDFAPERLSDWQARAPEAPLGLLALPALLSTHAKPTESFPIYRGVFVREQILCQPLPPPPENIGEPPPPAEGVTTRERYEQHSSDPACRSCHTLIDPLGFALENFDGVGRYRTTEEGHPIDATGELSNTDVDGAFADAFELSVLLSESETVRRCVARQWFRYVMQRFDQAADRCSIDTLDDAFARSGHRFEALRTAIVETPAFRMRRPINEEDSP